MAYDNTKYWVNLHQEVGGLRAVGWPALCEEFNKLKYHSEADSAVAVLEGAAQAFLAAGRTSVRVLEVGAGNGYWLDLVESFLREKGLAVELTAFDISQDVLDRLQTRKPQVSAVRGDLKSVDPDRFAGQFDLVMAFAVLHHLPTTSAHLNALRMVARSVAVDGFFILMDPILTKPYSLFDVFEFETYRGNGVPRHLYFIDDILDEEGLAREEFRPSVSFVLNANIEASGPLRYRFERRLWWLLSRLVYRSDRRTRPLASILLGVDRLLKRLGAGDSSSYCRYRRVPADPSHRAAPLRGGAVGNGRGPKWAIERRSRCTGCGPSLSASRNGTTGSR